eukprot:scaffold526669_cov19-Prasinocladus_malaysianus.AAC.2
MEWNNTKCHEKTRKRNNAGSDTQTLQHIMYFVQHAMFAHHGSRARCTKLGALALVHWLRSLYFIPRLWCNKLAEVVVPQYLIGNNVKGE